MTVDTRIQEGVGNAKEVLVEKKTQEQVSDEWSCSTNLLDDVKQGLLLGLPISFGQFVRMSSGLILSILLGRKDTYLLAGISSSMVWSEPLDELVRGIGSCVAALGAQAYGAGNFKLVGTWAQMSAILATVIGIPIAICKMMTGPILTFLGVPAIIAEPAGQFGTYVAFGCIAELYVIVLSSFLAAQSLINADVVVACAQLIFGGLATWFVLDVMNVGIFGMAMVMNGRRISHFILLCIVAKVFYKGFDKCWNYPRLSEIMDKERWVILISQVIPAGLDFAMQRINGSVNLAIAARLGQKQVAAWDLLTQMSLCSNVPIWGLCAGFSILMAYRLGAAQPRSAKGMAIAGAVMNYGLLTIFAIISYVFWPNFATFASKDPEVSEHIMEMRILQAAGYILSVGLVFMNEILVKQGRVVVVMMSVAPLLWLVGIPLSFLLAPHYGLVGIQIATCCAYGVAHLLCAWHVCRSDWDAISRQVCERAEA